MSLTGLKGRCHMGARCVRKCMVDANTPPDFEHDVCHEGECFPASVPIEK